jgi:hypothetical protein
VDKSPV